MGWYGCKCFNIPDILHLVEVLHVLKTTANLCVYVCACVCVCVCVCVCMYVYLCGYLLVILIETEVEEPIEEKKTSGFYSVQ